MLVEDKIHRSRWIHTANLPNWLAKIRNLAGEKMAAGVFANSSSSSMALLRKLAKAVNRGAMAEGRKREERMGSVSAPSSFYVERAAVTRATTSGGDRETVRAPSSRYGKKGSTLVRVAT